VLFYDAYELLRIISDRLEQHDILIMATGNIDVILSQLGWQDGFRIPVANEENKRLEEEVKMQRSVNLKKSYNFPCCIIIIN